MEVRPYEITEIANREAVMEGADMRVNILTLDAGQSIPWHYHSEITDYFVCLEGSLVVETKVPPQSFVLAVGERCEVGPKTAHYVHGVDHSAAKFLIIQGAGVYDNHPVHNQAT
jgi:quercetin dioxygenase-like cupin family protein